MHVRKMHCCGNDFCVVMYEPSTDYSVVAKKLCNRKLGVGAEGLIVVKANPSEMLYYNPDGKKLLMNCNALRCASLVLDELGYTRRGKQEIITGNGIIPLEIISKEPFESQVNLGKPLFNSSMLAVVDDLDCFGRTIEIDNHYITIYSLFLGDIHTVVFVDSFDDAVVDMAEAISKYRIFSKGTNVDFVKVISKDKIQVKSYERGVGYTLSNGDGCACGLVAAQKLGYTKTKVKAELELGSLGLEITKKGTVLVAGPVDVVFSCEI